MPEADPVAVIGAVDTLLAGAALSARQAGWPH
jgi:hypothetical protein